VKLADFLDGEAEAAVPENQGYFFASVGAVDSLEFGDAFFAANGGFVVAAGLKDAEEFRCEGEFGAAAFEIAPKLEIHGPVEGFVDRGPAAEQFAAIKATGLGDRVEARHQPHGCGLGHPEFLLAVDERDDFAGAEQDVDAGVFGEA